MNTLSHAFWGLSAIAVVMLCAIKVSGVQKLTSPEVQYYPHQRVADAFAKGETLAQGKSGQGIYKVMTAQREGPGEVEVHALDTDVFYIVKGTATFVTGGKVVDERHIAPAEFRGKSIEGGTPHHLNAEDVIIIPHGVPHWFKAVQSPFLYFVVKVR